MIKIVEIADVHFGANVTLTLKLYNDLLKCFIGWIKDNAPDVNIIAICGDLFHLKLSLTSDESQLAIRFIEDLSSNFPNARILLIKGTRSHDLNQLDVFKPKLSDNFKIYDTVTEDYYGEGFKYLVIPEEYYPDKSSYDKYFNTNEKYDWVFFHGMFDFAGGAALIQGSKFNKITFSPSDFENIVSGKVVGGHIHDPLVSKNGQIEYCGSFERWKHGEDLTKGFRYHEYDSEKKVVIKDEFIPNPNCQIFKTINFKDIDCTNLENLIKTLEKESKGLASLRVKVSKTDDITPSESENLVASCMQFSNVSLYKEAKIKSKDKTEDSIKESEERKKRIKEYENLSFEEITQKYAKEVLGKTITSEQIKEVLTP